MAKSKKVETLKKIIFIVVGTTVLVFVGIFAYNLLKPEDNLIGSSEDFYAETCSGNQVVTEYIWVRQGGSGEPGTMYSHKCGQKPQIECSAGEELGYDQNPSLSEKVLGWNTGGKATLTCIDPNNPEGFLDYR